MIQETFASAIFNSKDINTNQKVQYLHECAETSKDANLRKEAADYLQQIQTRIKNQYGISIRFRG